MCMCTEYLMHADVYIYDYMHVYSVSKRTKKCDLITHIKSQNLENIK